MRRRAYLGGFGAAVLAGCLSTLDGRSSGSKRSDLTPAENWTEAEAATTTFDESATPVCAEGEAVDGAVDGSDDHGAIVDHEFFEAETGRYGVRGRYEGSQIQWLDAAFSAGSRDVAETRHRIYGLQSDEPYEFVIVADDGEPSEVDGYRLTLPDGVDSGPGPSTEDGLELLEEEWGRIGEGGGEAVYGLAATVQNTGDDGVSDIYVRTKSYVDETVVHTGQEVVSELGPEETHTVYFPYRRCDPGRVTETDVRYFRLRDA